MWDTILTQCRWQMSSRRDWRHIAMDNFHMFECPIRQSWARDSCRTTCLDVAPVKSWARRWRGSRTRPVVRRQHCHGADEVGMAGSCFTVYGVCQDYLANKKILANLN